MDHKWCINCGKKHKAEESAQDKLRSKAKSIASFLCATCLWAQVGMAELDFGKAGAQDHVTNDFSMQSIDFAFSTNSGLTLSAALGDQMIDFAHICHIQHPAPPIQFYFNGKTNGPL